MENYKALLKEGKRIKYTINNPMCPNLHLREFVVEILFVDHEDEHYMFIAPYGPDGVSFNDAVLTKDPLTI